MDAAAVSSNEIASRSEDSDAIERRAAEFLQRRRFWNWTDNDQAELERWLADSTAHQISYLRLEAAGDRLERLAALRPSSVERRRPGPEVPEWLKRCAWAGSLAASIALGYVYGIPLVAELLQPADRVFATDVGGRAQLRFADATEIDLNTDSQIRYRITDKQRIVWLEHGEAYFRVSHDAKRPFTVFAAGARVADLGTEFVVRDESDSVQVSLLKGKAEVHAGRTGVAMLAPGDKATAAHGALKLAKMSPDDMADATAWRNGVLVFHNTKLADAVREFNRYTPVKLIIADPAIADLKIGGRFRTDNIRDFLQLAQAVLKIRYEQHANGILLFSNTETRARTKAREQ